MKKPQSTISRRKFVQISSASSALLLVGCIPSGGKDRLTNLSLDGEGTPLNQFISIDGSGLVTLFNHRPEMGQGTYQAIPMILAEELEADISKVKIVQSEANSDLYGGQMVVGSHSIQSEYMNCRKMGAAAREMLIQAAAKKWDVPVSECTASMGVVAHSSGKTLSYGELVAEASKLKAPTNPKLKANKDFKIIGQPVKRSDIPLKTNGQAKFGIDKTVPGMLYASVERSPVFLGKVVSYNEDEILKMPGVRHVLKTSRNVFGTDREGVAVLAENYWAAYQARKALKIEWDHKGLDQNSSATIRDRYYDESKKEGDVLFEKGNARSFLTGSEVLEASYETPYQAHVPMEPMNAIVSVEGNKAEFWGSTQNPNGIRRYLANFLSIPEKNITINYTFMGGGFGRRSLTDVAEEAADLSKKAGAPVKVIWTREDDQTQGPFRAASLNVCRGKLAADGRIEALEHKVVAQEIRNQTGNNNTAGRQLMGGITTDYSIPNLSVKGVLQKHYVPISYWRAVYHSTNPFAHESFIDELAIKAGKDPLEFRLSMMQDHPRFKRVLETVHDVSDWSNKPSETGRGIALCERSGAHFAMVVDVQRNGQGLKVNKITTAVDLGTCINPDTAKAQTEGSIVMGLGAALYGLTIENGAIAEQNWNTYPLLKISQTPEIVTHIIDSDADPDGAGESGLPTVAPALANAIFDLTGQRIRTLPFDLSTIS